MVTPWEVFKTLTEYGIAIMGAVTVVIGVVGMVVAVIGAILEVL